MDVAASAMTIRLKALSEADQDVASETSRSCEALTKQQR